MPRAIRLFGYLVAALVIGYLVHHSSNFSPENIRVDSLRPLPL
jgi:hypothetical protein